MPPFLEYRRSLMAPLSQGQESLFSLHTLPKALASWRAAAPGYAIDAERMPSSRFRSVQSMTVSTPATPNPQAAASATMSARVSFSGFITPLTRMERIPVRGSTSAMGTTS